jgi:hypothetical protein
MAAWWVRIDLLQNYFAIRNVCLRRWQIILTGFSAESLFIQSSTLCVNVTSNGYEIEPGTLDNERIEKMH